MTLPKTPDQLAEAIEKLVAGYVDEARQMVARVAPAGEPAGALSDPHVEFSSIRLLR